MRKPGRLAWVLAVDNDDELLDLVRLTLELTQRFQLVGEASDGGTAIALAAQLRPDAVVLSSSAQPARDGSVTMLATQRCWSRANSSPMQSCTPRAISASPCRFKTEC